MTNTNTELDDFRLRLIRSQYQNLLDNYGEDEITKILKRWKEAQNNLSELQGAGL